MYNFVIFGSDAEYLMLGISDVLSFDKVRYYSTRMSSQTPFIRLFCKIHTSPKINRYIDLPCKQIWNRFYFKNDFNQDAPLCFIFYPNNYWFRSVGYFEYLKEKYPRCKLAMVFHDMVEKYYDRYESFDPIYVKKTFDLVLSYNKYDVEKYGLVYYPGYMSKVQIDPDEQTPSSDVFFVGAAKDRLELILEVYEKLAGAGLKCDFHIMGVPECEQRYADQITYNQWLPYRDVLKRVAKTKCNLEVSQKGVLGFTFRTVEALLYNKKLLSNNPILVGTKFYNKAYVQYFQYASDIDVDAVKDESIAVNYHYNGEYSPVQMLEFIDRSFQS